MAVERDGSIYIERLQIGFPTLEGVVRAVDGITVRFACGQFTGVIGESGCGKSVLGQAVLGILPEYVRVKGRVLYQGYDVLRETSAIAGFYGRHFGIVPQNPGEALSPTRNIKKHMQDALRACAVADADDRLKTQALQFFGLSDYARIFKAYPHELSGGMMQRVLCAMSVLGNPKWVLADEPTKGLDEKNCGVVYENLLKIKARQTCSMLLITHDLQLARQVCDKVAVMYSGQVVECGEAVFARPRHPYTQAFFASLPENGFQPMRGRAPDLGALPEGCKFAPRCSHCSARCRGEAPPVYTVEGAEVRCHLYAAR